MHVIQSCMPVTLDYSRKVLRRRIANANKSEVYLEMQMHMVVAIIYTCLIKYIMVD